MTIGARLSASKRAVHAHDLQERLSTAAGGLVGAALATSDDRGDVRWAAVGTTTIGHPDRVSEGTLFEIGSLTKVATAAVVCQLADDGQIELDAPVSRWLPEALKIDRGSSISVRHLLCHSSGLVDLWEAAESLDAVIDRLASYELLAPPGELFSYSNPGYVLLGALIERVTARSWSENIRTRLVEPLGLTRVYLGDEPAEPSDVAQDHQIDAATSQPYIAATWPKIGLSYAAAGSTLKASVVDAARLGAALLFGSGGSDEREILTPSVLDEMQRLQVRIPGHGVTDAGWGLGWTIVDEAGNMVGHQGGTTAYILGSRTNRKVAVFLSNTVNGCQIGEKLIREIVGLQALNVAKPPPSKPRQDLAGSYSSPTMSVEIQNGPLGLFMTDPIDGTQVQLSVIADETFAGSIGGGKTEVSFLRGSENGAPSHIHIFHRALARV